MRTKTILLAGFALAIAGCQPGGDTTRVTTPGAQPAATTGPVQLQLAVEPNQEFRYRMTMSADAQAAEPGQAAPPTMPTSTIDMVTRVESVANDRVTMHTNIVDMRMGEIELPPEVRQQITQMRQIIVMDRRGQIVESRTEGGPPGMGDEATPQATVVLPDRPVTVGDTWTGQFALGGERQEVTYTLRGVEMVDGREVALVETTLPQQEGVQFDGPVRVWIDTATGMTYRMEATAVQQGQRMTIRMEQVAPAATTPDPAPAPQ
jgi:hypothetical protein